MAALTERVRLGVSIIVLPHRNPVHLAKSLATMGVLSQGRVIAGVGLGNEVHPTFEIPGERRVRRFTEVLEAMQALWAPGEARYAGELIRLDGVPQEPKPVQQPHPPLRFGSRVTAALAQAVKYADGWMGAGSSTVEDFGQQIAELRGMLERGDRDPATFTLSKRLYVAIGDDADRAERRLQEWFAHNYGNPGVGSKVSVWGPAERVYEAIDGLIESGAQHVLLNPVFEYDEHMERWRAFRPVEEGRRGAAEISELATGNPRGTPNPMPIGQSIRAAQDNRGNALRGAVPCRADRRRTDRLPSSQDLRESSCVARTPRGTRTGDEG